MFKIKNKAQYALYLIFTLLATITMLVSLVVMITAYVEPAVVDPMIKWITTGTSILLLLLCFISYETLIEYWIKREQMKYK